MLPLWYTPDYRIDKHIRTRVYYSDDDGTKWKQSKTLVDIPDSAPGAQEPGVVELKDGRLLMWMRTDKKKDLPFLFARSRRDMVQSGADGARFSTLAAVDQTDSHDRRSLLIWNNSPDKRFPSTAAISKDDGVDMGAHPQSR